MDEADTGIAMEAMLAGGDGLRVVGIPTGERNRRVLQRAGVRVVAGLEADAERPASPALPLLPLLIVPSDVAIELPLLRELPTPTRAIRLTAPRAATANVAWGPRDEVATAMAASVETLPAHAVDDGLLLDTSTPQAATEATRRLLRAAAKATDGIVSRNLNRPVSRAVSRWLLALGLTANHASVMNLLLGLVCAFFAAQTGWWTMVVAGALFQLTSALDGVDGEMARTTLTESAFGAWLDTIGDNVTYVACLLGVLVGWYREGIGVAGLALAVVLAVGVPLALGSLMRFVRRWGPSGSLVFIDRCVERAARDSGSPLLAAARWLFHGLRRDVFAFAFFLIAFSGVRASVPILVAGGSAVATATLVLGRRHVLRAARALREEHGLPPTPSD